MAEHPNTADSTMSGRHAAAPCAQPLSRSSRRLAGVLLLALPTVVYGGASLLTLLINDPAYIDNALRRDLWRAGHAHAGVLLILALVTLRYIDETRLPTALRALARHSIPAAAILLPAAFFLSVLTPDATEPNALIHLAYLGAVILAGGLLVLGAGLLRSTSPVPRRPRPPTAPPHHIEEQT